MSSSGDASRYFFIFSKILSVCLAAIASSKLFGWLIDDLGVGLLEPCRLLVDKQVSLGWLVALLLKAFMGWGFTGALISVLVYRSYGALWVWKLRFRFIWWFFSEFRYIWGLFLWLGVRSNLNYWVYVNFGLSVTVRVYGFLRVFEAEAFFVLCGRMEERLPSNLDVLPEVIVIDSFTLFWSRKEVAWDNLLSFSLGCAKVV